MSVPRKKFKISVNINKKNGKKTCNTIAVQAVVHQPCSPDINAGIVPKTSAENVRNYRARKREKLQNNLDEILTSSPVPLTAAERMRNYPDGQNNLKTQADSDLDVKRIVKNPFNKFEVQAKVHQPCSPDINVGIVPKTSAENLRNYQARKREEKLLDEILASSPIPLTATEHMFNYREGQYNLKTQADSDLDVKRIVKNPFNKFEVQAKVHQPCSPDINVGIVPKTSAENLRNYQARIREEKLLDEILASSPIPLTATEHMFNYREGQYNLTTQADSDLDVKRLVKNPCNTIEVQAIVHQPCSPDINVGIVPKTNAENIRNYRARKREEKLQQNLDEILTLSPVPFTAAERIRNDRDEQNNLKTQSENLSIDDVLPFDSDNDVSDDDIIEIF